VKKKSGKKRDEPRAYLAKIKDGYLAVVEGDSEAEIKDRQTIKKIEKLLKVRKKAGEQLSEIIEDKAISTCSIHKAAIVLGEGD
jgi:hypothetical protein